MTPPRAIRAKLSFTGRGDGTLRPTRSSMPCCIDPEPIDSAFRPKCSGRGGVARTATPRRALSSQRLLEVLDQIVYIFDPDRQSSHAIADPQLLPGFLRD